MGVQDLLRKSVIEKMASPEQLDMAMRVTSPASWVALLTFGVIVLTAVIGSIVGRIPERVDGSGLILRGAGVEAIEVQVNAKIEKIYVQTGDQVKQGQVVAQLDLRDLEAKIRTSEDRIASLESQLGSAQAGRAGVISGLESELSALYRRRRQVQELVNKQIKTRNDLAEIDGQITGKKAQILQQKQGGTQQGNQLAEEQRNLEVLREQYEASARLVSPVDGTVAAILKREGQLIAQGERLMNLEDPSAPFRVLLFVPFAEGKKVKAGMPVKISPDTVKPEEFGYILGRIDSISSQAVTFDEVKSTLNNDQLAQKFASDTPFLVDASPRLDTATVSGFEWTSGSGPPDIVTGNTPCKAQIVVATRRPISLVIPILKKAVGAA